MQPARITWHGDQPRAPDFDDIYFSADGVTEVQRVFIEPAGLLKRAERSKELCVAELGFGTGLNFTVLAEAIRQQGDTRLRFISFEKFPLRVSDWQRVIATRQARLPIYAELEGQYPPLLPGWHQRVFNCGRVVLQVYHGDVAEGLADLVTRQRNAVDAWFLDGFAPDRNADMWDPALFQQMAKLAHDATTVTTFTAAGHVRRGLQAAGFNMHKVDQMPFKRESLAGVFAGATGPDTPLPPTRARVHGAGMAGAFTARHLAEAGVQVTVFDPNGIAGGASAMPAAVLHARLLADASPQAELRSSAFHYAATYLRRFAGFRPDGVVWIQGPNMDQRKLERISRAYGADDADQHHWIVRLGAAEAAEISGAPIGADALFHPLGGVVDGPSLCAELLTHPNIEVQPVQGALAHDHPQVVCTASAARQLPGCDLLEIIDIHGQLDLFTSTQPPVHMPIVGNGYLVPTATGCVLGATYEHQPWNPEQATAHNRRLNAHLLGDTELCWQGRRRGARCVASDRAPLVGRIAGIAPSQQDAGVWMHTGLGSMGTTAGVLAAAAISAEVLGWLVPLATRVTDIWAPGRFAARQARRGVRHIQPSNGSFETP